MARFLAQLLTPVFLVVGVGGLLLGDAGTPGKGELGGLDLDMTWARDVIDLVLFLAFVAIAFVLTRHGGRLLMAAAGVLLLTAGVIGSVAGDGGFAGLRGSLATNLFSVLGGALALLAAAGTIEEPEPPQGSFLRGG